MASEMSKLLKRAVDSYTEEIAKEENKKIEIALDNTMKYVEEKVDEYLEWMAQAYYEGYDPVWYVRTNQLQNKSTRPVNPFTEINTMGGASTLKFGVIFDEKSMNHGSYTVKARWYDKKNKKWKDVKKSKTYNVTPGKKKGKKPSEIAILKFYKEGIHPNAVLDGITDFPTPEPLFTSKREGAVPDLIDHWLKSGVLQKKLNDELKKLK